MLRVGQLLPIPYRSVPAMTWRFRGTPSREASGGEFRRKAQGMFCASWQVMQRTDLSFGAKLLYCVLRTQDDSVICIDPRAIADFVGVSPEKVRGCLAELRHAGVITGWMGNLLFFT